MRPSVPRSGTSGGLQRPARDTSRRRVQPLLGLLLPALMLTGCSSGLSSARWWLGEEPKPPAQETPGQPPAQQPAPGQPPREAPAPQAAPEKDPAPGDTSTAAPGDKPLSEQGRRSLERAKRELELGHAVEPDSGLYPWPKPPPPPENPRIAPPPRAGHELHGLAVGIRNAGHPQAIDPLLSLRFHNTRGIVPDHQAGETLPRLAFALPLALIADSYLGARVTWPALSEPWPLFLGLALFDTVELAWRRTHNSGTLPALGALGAVTEQGTQVNYGWLYAWPGMETLGFTATVGRRGRTFFLPDSPTLRASTPRLMFKQASVQIGVRWAPLPYLLLSLDDELWGSAVARTSTIPGAVAEQALASSEPFLRRPVFLTVSARY